jgi:hypothetical protein
MAARPTQFEVDTAISTLAHLNAEGMRRHNSQPQGVAEKIAAVAGTVIGELINPLNRVRFAAPIAEATIDDLHAREGQ